MIHPLLLATASFFVVTLFKGASNFRGGHLTLFPCLNWSCLSVTRRDISESHISETVAAYTSEFPESLVSDSRSRVSRSKTRIGLGLGLDVQGSTRLGLRIGIVVMAPVAIDLELVRYFRDFIGENGVSDSKYRVSRL